MEYTTIQNASTKIVDNLKIIDGSINALQNKQDIISTNDMSMTNSHNGKLKIEEIGGKCEQVSTTGAQLFNCKELAYQDHIAEQDNGFFTFSNSTSFNEFPSHIYELPTGNYVVTVEVESNNNSTFYVTSTVSDYSKPITGVGKHIITFTDVDLVWICIAGKDGASVKMRIMLNAGDTSLPYEPYTGGIPAPNPDYPQEIKKTVVSEIKTRGKNCCPTYGHSGSAVVWLSVREKAKNYVAYGTTFVKGSGAVLFEVAGVKDGVITILSSLAYTSTVNIKNIPTNGYDEVIVACYSNNADNELKESFVYLYDEPTTESFVYEPYTETTIKLSEPIELYGIGDVKDTIEDGKVVRRFATTILDDTGGYRYFNKAISCNIVDNLIKPSDSNYVIPKILSEKFSPDTPSNVLNGANENRITVSIAADTYRIRLHSDSLTSAEEAISYFTENPMTVVYELAEPIIEPLPAVDQIALNSLSTYDNITYVEFDSEIEPTFQAEYGVTEIGGRVLEDLMTGLNSEILAQSDADRITALELTIVNNIQD